MAPRRGRRNPSTDQKKVRNRQRRQASVEDASHSANFSTDYSGWDVMSSNRETGSLPALQAHWSDAYVPVDQVKAEQKMRAEAQVFYRRLSDLAKKDREELTIQATDRARHLASQFAPYAAQAQVAFLDAVTHHATRDGIKVAFDMPKVAEQTEQSFAFDDALTTSASSPGHSKTAKVDPGLAEEIASFLANDKYVGLYGRPKVFPGSHEELSDDAVVFSWEEGPEGWVYEMAPEVSSVYPQVWAEPVSSWALAVYPAETTASRKVSFGDPGVQAGDYVKWQGWRPDVAQANNGESVLLGQRSPVRVERISTVEDEFVLRDHPKSLDYEEMKDLIIEWGKGYLHGGGNSIDTLPVAVLEDGRAVPIESFTSSALERVVPQVPGQKSWNFASRVQAGLGQTTSAATSYEVLKTIQAQDPDGGEVEPTQAAYDAFEAWVVSTYGQQAWTDYMTTVWDMPDSYASRKTATPWGLSRNTPEKVFPCQACGTPLPRWASHGAGDIQCIACGTWHSPFGHKLENPTYFRQRAAERKTSSRIDTLRDIVDSHRGGKSPQSDKVDGIKIDPQTANMLVTLYDALGDKNKDTFETLDLMKLVNFGWSKVTSTKTADGEARPSSSTPRSPEEFARDMYLWGYEWGQRVRNGERPPGYGVVPGTENSDKPFPTGHRDGREGKPKNPPKTAAQGLSVGDILYSSWGYDQTNIDFYEVVGATANMVTIRQIAAENTAGELWGHGTTVPVKGRYVGEPMRRKVQKYGPDKFGVNINSFAGAWLWDGTPKSFTSYATKTAAHWGFVAGWEDGEKFDRTGTNPGNPFAHGTAGYEEYRKGRESYRAGDPRPVVDDDEPEDSTYNDLYGDGDPNNIFASIRKNL